MTLEQLAEWVGNISRLGDEHVCFVVAHLAAFQDAADRRNADFLDISTRLQFVSEMTSHGGYIYSRIVDSA